MLCCYLSISRNLCFDKKKTLWWYNQVWRKVQQYLGIILSGLHKALVLKTPIRNVKVQQNHDLLLQLWCYVVVTSLLPQTWKNRFENSLKTTTTGQNIDSLGNQPSRTYFPLIFHRLQFHSLYYCFSFVR